MDKSTRNDYWLTQTLINVTHHDLIVSDDDLLDGFDQSDMLLYGTPSERDQFIYNLDIQPNATYGNAAIRYCG